jgi:hypothetical protein
MLCGLPSPVLSHLPPSTSFPSSPPRPPRSSRRAPSPVDIAALPHHHPGVLSPIGAMRPRTAGLVSERPVAVVPLRKERSMNEGRRRVHSEAGDSASKENERGGLSERSRRPSRVNEGASMSARAEVGLYSGSDVDFEMERLASRCISFPLSFLPFFHLSVFSHSARGLLCSLRHFLHLLHVHGRVELANKRRNRVRPFDDEPAHLLPSSPTSLPPFPQFSRRQPSPGIAAPPAPVSRIEGAVFFGSSASSSQVKRQESRRALLRPRPRPRRRR